TTNPAPGVERIFYGRADDLDIAAHLTQDIESHSSLSQEEEQDALALDACRMPLYLSPVPFPTRSCTWIGANPALLINSLPKTRHFKKIQDKKEAICFRDHQASLGTSHEQYSMLPRGLDRITTTFGTKVIQDISAGELINPPKTSEEVDKEAREGRDLYIVSHNDYYVEEAINRKYHSPNFSKSFVYGTETPHFKDGQSVSKSLNWLYDLQSKRAAIVSKQSDDFKEKFQPQLGKVLDPIAETMNVPRGHTFGMLLCPDEYRVGGHLHCWVPCEFLHGKDRERAVFTAVQQSLKKGNYENFDMLLEAFRHYDKVSALKKYKWKKLDTPVLPEDTKRNDKPLLKQEDLVLKEPGISEKTPRTLRRTDHIFANYQTTTSQYNAVVGGLPTTYYPACGVPSIRSDIPAPRNCPISDRTNYGDEANAYELLPSVKRVYARDFFKARPKAEIAQILCNIDVNISDERFEEIWKQACMKHQKEEVCVESIRTVLDEIHGSHTKTSC
ncbi:LOW QUALITY PROTEIN: EF-hand domain-containing family member B, partial [Cariama cristata]